MPFFNRAANKEIFLVAGLGNPGKTYANTRHNVGFACIDALVDAYRIPQSGLKFNAMYGKGVIEGRDVILMKPLSYMNLSGGPIQQMCAYFKVEPSTHLLVIHDDIDLPFGQLRIRKSGSAGGHNGMKDIVRALGTQEFARIRIGVGAKPEGWDLADYVLSHFSREEERLMDETVKAAADAVSLSLKSGIDIAMNTYNRKAT